MKDRLCYNRERRLPATRLCRITLIGIAWWLLVSAQSLMAGEAPQWMHSLRNVPLPTYDEKTDAVLLYSEEVVTVTSADKLKRVKREAYKILRPAGREYGVLQVRLDSLTKIVGMKGWCIPAEGKDYEVREKDATETSYRSAGGSLYPDLKLRLLQIPAPDPGNIIGYEYEVEENLISLQDGWYFQEEIPVLESHYSLRLPAGWKYKSSWLNSPEVPLASEQPEWVVKDVKPIRREDEMPPWRGVAGQMLVSLIPPTNVGTKAFFTWQEMGKWYLNLTSDRIEASPGIKQKTGELTAAAKTTLDKLKAIGRYVQEDIRYVAIELGIGGWQPYPAASVFENRYGDCKDKATLVRSMLRELGLETYHVVINTTRGSITPSTPAHHGFNHAIVAIKLPDEVDGPSLVATIKHPKYGRILFFDPTDVLTPFGQIAGSLQANYALVVFPDGGELLELPKQPASLNSIRRTAKLTLDERGMLKGDVEETRQGDRAWSQRWALRKVTSDAERIKPIENLLAASLPIFRITKASALNIEHTDQPFGFTFSFEADNYAKRAGSLLLVRPRVVGSKGSGLLETKEPRKFAIEFEAPVHDTDVFEIALPSGYEVDDVPPPVDAEYSFATYHSKTEVANGVIRYTRTFEIRELSVPAARADELKKFYRIIAGDERNAVVLRAASK